MELKHFSEAICKFNVINPQIVDITKKIIVIIGCPGLSNRLDDVVNNIVMTHACHRVDDRNYYNTEFGLQKYCFDDSHPVDQIALVNALVEEMKNDGLAPHVFVYTNSPFILQAFFHFNGRPAGDIAFYECGFNETGREILLTDVSADTKTAFAHMAAAMNSIMDVTEVFSKKNDAELRRPKYVRFTKKIDYWLEMVELNGKIYDQMDDVAAWSNLRKDFPSLVNDKDEIELLINIENGHIENWPDGKTGDFRSVKIVDTGHYELLDIAQRKLRVLDGYVPKFLSIEDKGYGDYLEFEVDAKGYIKNWKFGNDELKETEKWDECFEQEEQKSAEVESKFHKGEWITNGDYTWNIVEVKPLDYILQSQDGNIVDDTISYVDEQFHSFTIEDAKDGDVLATKNAVFIFKHIDKTGLSLCKSYCEVIGNSELGLGFDFSINGVNPATKEQRDILFNGMADAGYTFDFEKKELKKIGNKIEIPFGAKDSELQEATYYIPKGFHAEINDDKVVIKKGEKFTTWSEEDERNLNDAILFIETGTYSLDKDNLINWLKSLKDKAHPQLKQEWKQENTGDLTDFENAMMHIGGSFFGDNADLDPNDTNAIKEQANLLLELVPSKEWSEEDERLFQIIIDILDRENHLGNISRTDLIACVRKLKSLRLKSQWKPSDEQMEVLDEAIDICSKKRYRGTAYRLDYLLRQDLKKLKGDAPLG